MKKLSKAGARSEKDLNDITNEVEDLNKREQSLLERESIFSAELDLAQTNLTNLNARLDEIDRDMAKSAGDNGPQKRPK